MSAIQLLGLSAVLGNLSEVQSGIGDATSRGVMKAAFVVERSAKLNAPVATGNLRRSITAISTGPTSARVETNERYAIFPEMGTGRGWTARGPVAYMQRAVTENIKAIEEAVGGEVRVVIR